MSEINGFLAVNKIVSLRQKKLPRQNEKEAKDKK
jgi:hypothetical protein